MSHHGIIVAGFVFLTFTSQISVCAVTSKVSAPSENTVRWVLDNGLTVLMYPVAEADEVALETIYRVGFIHEHKGMTQLSHLIEHLMCRCGTKSYQAGQSFQLLNRKGSANAETLADFTHYDYILPIEELELALRVEAERIASLQITKDVIAQEALKCYQETDIVERNPQAGMLKHAFMAFNQAWRYGEKIALVRGGLEEIAVAQLSRFHRSFYHPGNMILVLVGGFDRDEAGELVAKHLGTMNSIRPQQPESIDWPVLMKEMTIEWDSSVSAVCVGYAPPEEIRARLILSLWGNLLMHKFTNDPRINELASAVFTSNQMWPVGILPFFAYAAAKPNVDTATLRQLLADRLQNIISATPSLLEVSQIRSMASAMIAPAPLTTESVRQQATVISTQLGLDKHKARGMVMANFAIQAGLRELLISRDGEDALMELNKLSAEELQRILRRYLGSSKQFFISVIPNNCRD